ncbi:MAG: SurA N-terminal domain-containing protein [Mariprofundales bacterium]|nr:SurA N-terminal domain-containing protein [Mariprofundales bacterium]
MLETMRNSAQSWLAKLILGGIAFSFALWGVGDYFSGSRVEYVANVDGHPITKAAFAQAYDRQVNAYRNMLGKQFSRALIKQFHVKNDTVQMLINRRIMLDEADRLGLVAPKAVLIAKVEGTPAFRSGGVFDANRYRALTRNMGYPTTRDFENEQRLNLMVDALQQSVMRSATVSDADVHDKFDREYEQRVIQAIVVDPSSLKRAISVSDADARSYYAAHKGEFESPLRVQLQAVVIDPTKMAKSVEVSAADLAASYQKRKAEFVQPEQRQASHILIKVAKNASAAMVAMARKKIDAAKARLDKGEAFAAVAKDVSEDSNADQGGDLGFFPRSAMVPAFDKAVFALKKGDVSGVVRTKFGFHLIKLTAIKPEHQQSLAEVKGALTHDLQRAKAGDEAYQLSQDLDDALGREASLTAAAKKVDLPVVEMVPMGRSEAIDNKLLASNPDLMKRAFSITKDDAVEVTELDGGSFVALAVVKRIPPQPEPFAKVAAAVHQTVLEQRAQERAKALAKKILQAGEGGAHLNALVQQFGQPKFISKPVRSNGLGDQASWLSGSVLAQAFDQQPGHWLPAPISTSSGLVVARVAKVIAAKDAKFSNQKAALRQSLMQSKGAVRFARWMASVRLRHEIKRFPKVLNQF